MKNITYQGPIIVDIFVTAGSQQVNVTYSSVTSPSVELRNPNGFELCCLGKKVCTENATVWVSAPASEIKGAPLTIGLTVPNSCIGKSIDGLRYLWRETPCLFKQAAIYSTLDSNLPAPPYIKLF
jgi:sialate O-acetylesterase